ncbi:MAG: hypothetical protein ONB48_20055 [candidate division KSB1 bacterium]|nr:hypothetical protein [candidate division KSB1 bacterium]MDZ7276253.1 hypothetical protein [candidate division KSB1 bacterium]MDZ7287941.1 hypothetical protein [candidate division KSB1 bacterium]MDZ7300046.1 hypothetical protein [candidate division KSB1 bacterium]MDZ7308752.1 hypothetical protein [candidate division KSB1 bacterium]
MLQRSCIAWLCLSLWLVHCARQETSAPPAETLIARIGDKTISLNEFIRRMEYTPRPPYCRGEDYVQRKIALNSLIAEKLLALEAGEQNALTRSEAFQLYLQGRKEQAMRQWQYYEEAYKPAQVTAAEVKAAYEAAGRKYRIAYFTCKDSSQARQMRRQIQEQGRPFAEIPLAAGTLDSLPQREVEWNSPEPPAIHAALYSQPRAPYEVLGPIATGEGSYVLLQVLGWTETLPLTDTQQQQRWQQVRERLKQQKAEALYDQFIARVMRGKRLDFAPQTFRRLVAIVAPYYLQSNAAKGAALQQQLWGTPENRERLQHMSTQLDALLDEPLMQIDGQLWTVRDFEREIKLHPLVFRKTSFPAGEFAEQLRLAIVDMVRDRYLTQEAYKKGYDRVPEVQRYTGMWKDNLLFLHQQNEYLKARGKQEAFNKNFIQVITEDLNPYVKQLQRKYHDLIEINTEVFERTPVTRIDMLVTQSSVPFPVVVPAFPLITTAHQLDYGRNMP